MQIKQSAPWALTGCLLISAAMGVRADVKVVQTTTLVNAQYAQMAESMTAKQKAAAHRAGMDLMMGVPQVSTVYMSGQHLRVDAAGHYVVYDTAASTQTTVNIASKTYTTVSTAGMIGRAGAFQATVIPAKKHSVILGHPATAYFLKATSVSFPGQLISGEIWSADDIGRPNLPSSGILSQFASLLQQFKGLPLTINLKITGTSAGEIDVHSKVVSISQASLPASTFRVPAGYKAGDPNAAPGNPFGGLGGM